MPDIKCPICQPDHPGRDIKICKVHQKELLRSLYPEPDDNEFNAWMAQFLREVKHINDQAVMNDQILNSI